jgi:orotate phosphoribosyltransferase
MRKVGDPGADLFNSLRRTAGHFRFESGYHGDMWLDLESLFLRPADIRDSLVELGRRLSQYRVDAVCGPLTGGAFAAALLAAELGVEFFYSEQVAAPTSAELLAVRYRIPESLRDGAAGKRFAVVNDVTSAGSAVRGTVADLDACGGRTVAIGSLIVLGPSISSFARSRDLPLETLATVDQAIWEPSQCPLCATGIPLTVPSYGPAVTPRVDTEEF